MKGMLRSGLGLLCGMLLAQPSAPRIEKKVTLVIGNDAYLYVTPLKTATNDARSVQSVLQGRYGFETTLLLNATRAQIVSALNAYRRDLGPDSSLLIYYAGHGFYDQAVDKAYWWPVDAKEKDNTDWISADDITTNIKGIPSRHVLIVSDSCYSGALRGVSVPQNLNGLNSDRARTLLRLDQRPSRELMASGGNEPVSDGGAGQHSVFAGAFLRALERMQAAQFAAHELFEEVLTSVAGNSAQVPQFDPLRNSGDDGGSFVFSRAGEVASVTRPAPGTTTRTEAPPPTPAPEPPATRKLLPEFPLPPPSDPSAELLTLSRSALLVMRDNPKMLTDDVVLALARSQVAIEQSMWFFIDNALKAPQSGLNPKRPTFIYEWQKLIDQNPALARGPAMDVFEKADADWSFLKREKEWDSQFESIDDVFIFSHDQVIGPDGKLLDNEFTARRLQPVVRKHLEAAAAKAPSKLWFTVMLPAADYDFTTSAMRFKKQGQNAFVDSIDLLDPPVSPLAFEPAPAGAKIASVVLPAAARLAANYRPWYEGRYLMSATEATIKPGVVFWSAEKRQILSPAEGWRSRFSSLALLFPVSPVDLALDRQLRIASIPLDAAKAEALHPMMHLLRAQVFIDVDRGQSVQVTSGSTITPSAVLFAKVTKIKILDYLGEVVITLDPKALPLPDAK